MAKTKGRSATVTKITSEALVAAATTGNERRVVALGGGTYAYLHHPLTGRIAHVKVASEAFDSTVAEHAALSVPYAARLERELAAFDQGDFPAALARLRDAGVFAAG
jgi:hypothetical protein